MRGTLAAVLCISFLAPLAVLADGQSYEASDPGLGFNMISWWNDPQGEALWESSVQQVYDYGFRHVSICPVRYFDPSTGAIAASSPKGPELSHIAAGVAKAKSLGMTVTVNPFVEPENFTFWRGQWDPSGGVATQFWSDYQQYLADVATVAQTHGADRMTVGSELRAIVRDSSHNASLTGVISAVDGIFTGSLGYAANHDNYRNSNLTSTVWENAAIDFIGVDAYFQLATNTQADASGDHPDSSFIDVVEGNWNAQLDNNVLPFASARKDGTGMPVVLTEHGLIPYNRTTVKPYSEDPLWQGQPVDPNEQINGLAGMLDATDGRAAADDLAEIYLWQWGMPGAHDSLWFLNPQAEDNDPGGKFDEALGIPAAEFLSAWAFTAQTQGDLDTDGTVSFLEAATTVANIGKGAALWKDGDFDHDRIVSVADADAAVGAYLTAVPPSIVPEPASLSMLLAMLPACALRARRRAGRAD